MKVNLIPMDEFVKLNKLKPVTNPITFERDNTPTVDGLLSFDIFGSDTNSRKGKMAYIDLQIHFFHPHVYKVIKRFFRNVDYIISGTKYYRIEKGQLIEDENGETGIEWLYANWDNIKWEKNNSTMRNERIDLLNAYPKTTIFMDKYPVIPAYYRDMNLQTREKTHEELNDLYAKLIRLCQLTQTSGEFDFILHANNMAIQKKLVEVYDHFKVKKVEKKNGHIRKANLGKTTRYGSRLIITSPRHDENRPDDAMVSFEYSAVPMAQLCAMFFPFVAAWVKRWFMSEFEANKFKYPVVLDPKKPDEIKYIKLKDPSMYFTDDYIHEYINKFIYGYSERFMLIDVPVDNPDDVGGKEFINPRFKGVLGTPSATDTSLVDRPLTWTDILYRACMEVTEDKHIVVCRYPVSDYFSTFFTRINVLSTIETIPVMMGNKVYKNYPKIDLNMPKEKVETFFQGSLSFSNVYLKGIGGDYDGDQVTVKPLFSVEANEEAERIMHKKSNLLMINGESNRVSTNESIQTMYQMTRFAKKK